MQDDQYFLGSDQDGYQCEEPLTTHKNDSYSQQPCQNSIYRHPNILDSIIPKCYRDLIKKQPRIDYLHEETLFYIFYNCPGDSVQIQAYKALIERQYYFHVKMNFFISFSGEKIADESKRKITYFDCYLWSKDYIEVTFDKEFVDQLRN
ncbi:hypothetical protein GVAV_000312 [Gurleya vavrai]